MSRDDEAAPAPTPLPTTGLSDEVAHALIDHLLAIEAEIVHIRALLAEAILQEAP